jgi:hypothetical protein
MIFRRLDERTIVIVADDQETEIGRMALPRGGCTSAEIEQFIEHLKRETARKEHGPS